MAHVFVSYRHETADFAYRLSSRLEDQGFTVMVNPDPHAGESWSPWIDRALGDALAVIALITPESGTSPVITYEWAYALGAGIGVIPVVLAETDLPARLEALHPLDFVPPAQPWDELLGRLWERADQRATFAVETDAPPDVAEAVRGLNARQAETRRAAVETLAGIDHPAARAALAQAAQHPVYRAVRLDAVSVLARLNHPEALAGLLAALRDPDTDVNRTAAQAVSRFGEAAVPDLVAMVRGTPPIPRAAVWALSLIATPATVPGLIAALGLGGWFAPRTAAVTLGQIGSADAVPGLIEALDSEDETLVSLALTALRQIGTPDALEAAGRHATNQDRLD